MVVKALRTDELDRDLSAVLEEAGALEQLHHEAIIRLRDCGCADTNQTTTVSGDGLLRGRDP